MDDHSSVPIKDDGFHNLAPEEIVEIFENATSLYKDKISNVPPVHPIEGQIFLFDLGPDKCAWEKQKKQMRYEHLLNNSVLNELVNLIAM